MYPYVRQHYTWYSVSLPLHYPSRGPERLGEVPVDEELFSDLLGAVIDHISPTRPVLLVGYSLGAFAAMNYAAKNPDRVRGVVSISGFAMGRAGGLESVLQFFSRGKRIRKWLFHLGWRFMRLHYLTLKVAVTFYACNVRALHRYSALDATLKAIFPDVRRHDPEAMRHFFRWLLDMNWLDEAHHLQLPVLAIAGACDPIIPYRHQRRYAAQLPRGEFVTLARTGHVPFAEAPEAFEAHLIGWLDRLEGGAS